MHHALPVINDRFHAPNHYKEGWGKYTLLPFRFLSLDENRYVLTNFAGEHFVLPKPALHQLIRHELTPQSEIFDELRARHFLVDGQSMVALDLLAMKYRTKQSILSRFTSLFLFVTTLRCDHSCIYCQVSRESADRIAFDMTETMATKAVDLMFRTPSPTIKVEFQGGEPLLNFDLIRFIVRLVEQRNAREQKNVAFVVATSLSNVVEEHLEFCRDHDICISTSLDGPADLHNKNRPRPGRDSYERTIAGIQRAKSTIGAQRVAALMTTTEASLLRPTEIIDEYVRRGFSSIFLRSISPYGFAAKTGAFDRYHTHEWLEFYKRGLAHIIDLNLRGISFREEYAAMILRKILTPYPTRYVDLQSPAGIGIGCLVFNYNGEIYASDEGRMLAEMGDKTFRLGTIEDSLETLVRSSSLLRILSETMTEVMPMCSECGVQPYCGSDPVYHHAVHGDWVGAKPSSDFCKKNMGVIRHLITLMEDNPEAAKVFGSWV